MSLIIRAAQFAASAHHCQVRKYTGLPYITHPARVAGMVSIHPVIANEENVAIAWLHDVVEDCGIRESHISDRFGAVVTKGVTELTNWSVRTGAKERGINRQERKWADLCRLEKADPDIKIIKLMDRLDNLREFDVAMDPKFARVYLNETVDLLKAIGTADSGLSLQIRKVMEKHFATGCVL
jgi:guanosine-3',5'-bis(diphosphate) 3'-pyrophosphohydrolase